MSEIIKIVKDDLNMIVQQKVSRCRIELVKENLL